MKTQPLCLAISLAASMILATAAHAQLGGLGGAAGGNLNGTLNGGMNSINGSLNGGLGASGSINASHANETLRERKARLQQRAQQTSDQAKTSVEQTKASAEQAKSNADQAQDSTGGGSQPPISQAALGATSNAAMNASAASGAASAVANGSASLVTHMANRAQPDMPQPNTDSDSAKSTKNPLDSVQTAGNTAISNATSTVGNSPTPALPNAAATNNSEASSTNSTSDIPKRPPLTPDAAPNDENTPAKKTGKHRVNANASTSGNANLDSRGKASGSADVNYGADTGRSE